MLIEYSLRGIILKKTYGYTKMGIGDENFKLLEFMFSTYNIKTVLELGAQNFYHHYPTSTGTARYGEYAHKYYSLKGVSHYENIDMNGENNALVFDLTQPIAITRKYDLVTDLGTCEHISTTLDKEKLYTCWTTKYNASKRFIISSNPSTGHWPKHGAYFFTTEFYQKLADITGMKIIKLQYHYSMGNYETGRETACILEKTSDSHWITLEEFSEAFSNVYSS